MTKATQMARLSEQSHHVDEFWRTLEEAWPLFTDDEKLRIRHAVLQGKDAFVGALRAVADRAAAEARE